MVQIFIFGFGKIIFQKDFKCYVLIVIAQRKLTPFAHIREENNLEDRFYSYSSFSTERLKGIMIGWDGLTGYHGLQVKTCADRLEGKLVFDVGCGLCHLYQYLTLVAKKEIGYVGIDVDERVVKWAKKRYPHLDIRLGSVYDLSEFGMFDTVFAIGLYNGEPERIDGVREMLEHTKIKLIMTYFHKEKGNLVFLNKIKPYWSKYNIIPHNIDERLTILEVY